MSEIIDIYLRNFGEKATDPLCPEIQIYRTKNLSELWEKVCEIEGGDSPIPFWGIVWPGGRAIARYILDHRNDFAGKNVLDMAAGSGIATIAAALSGAIVLAVDIDPAAEEIALLNAALNGVEAAYSIRDVFSMTDEEMIRFDWIVAGDVFYESLLAKKSSDFLKRASEMGIQNLAADAGRVYRPENGIRVLASMDVPVEKEIEGRSSRKTDIICF